jgi:hypothetical protein
MSRRKPLAERWASFVKKTDTCWLWTGYLTGGGYGYISRGGREGASARAHRVSWELHRGEIPPGLMVCHHCDVRACVNPDHLFLGTALDNKRDEIQKGRQAPPEVKRHIGVENGRAKLSEEDVRAIRELYASLPRKKYVSRGGLTAISRRFGVHPDIVRRVACGGSWRHIP